MSSSARFPEREAINLIKLWRVVRPGERAIDVGALALEWSSQTHPSDRIRHVHADTSLGGFEGGLFRLPSDGWAILYNPRESTPGRANFTVAHEFGHYVLHRTAANRFECSTSATLGMESGTYKDREREADTFASTLLMPADDFRAQIGGQRITLDLLSHCAERYGVSLTAAALRWVRLTDQCAALVASVDGFIRWYAKSSTAPYRLWDTVHPGAELPADTGAVDNYRSWSQEQKCSGVNFCDTWLRDAEGVEMGIVSDRYDLTLTLLHFGHVAALRDYGDEEPDEDAELERAWTPRFS